VSYGWLQVALEKTKGDTAKAIELLRKYVDIFMTDSEAWAELADLYAQVPL
jgi:Tetratricopeptide repeat